MDHVQDCGGTGVELHLDAGNLIYLKNPSGVHLCFVYLDYLNHSSASGCMSQSSKIMFTK